MNRLLFTFFAVVGSLLSTSGYTDGADVDRQLYEVRSYLLGDDGDEAAIDAYLSQALLPAP